MKKIFFLVLFVASFASVNSQAKQDRTGNLIGYAQKSDFLKNQYKGWFEYHYKKYDTDKEVVQKIKKNLKDISVLCFMGTWCKDSKREVPRFYKIMEEANFDFKNDFKLIALNWNKRTPDNLQAGYNIFRVPTFVFYKRKQEIGRLVEYPRQIMEKDILRILERKTYKHSYEK